MEEINVQEFVKNLLEKDQLGLELTDLEIVLLDMHKGLVTKGDEITARDIEAATFWMG